MAYFSTKIKIKRFVDPLSTPFSISLFQRLSLRSVKVLAGGTLLCIVLGFILLWQPAYLQLKSLQKEKNSLQHLLNASITNPKLDPDTITKFTIPTMDQLPEMIEQCRGAFIKEGVNVVTINVERFGERVQAGTGESLDFGLVRFHLQGDWAEVVSSLKALEDTADRSFHVQEVILDTDGGEALLQINFCP